MKTNGKKARKPLSMRSRSVSRVRKVRAHALIWEEILKIAHSIPESALHKLPTDFAEKHDHYLYGSRLS